MQEDTLLTDEQIAKKKKRNEIIDKITTGLLIFLMASPFLILAYIFIATLDGPAKRYVPG